MPQVIQWVLEVSESPNSSVPTLKKLFANIKNPCFAGQLKQPHRGLLCLTLHIRQECFRSDISTVKSKHEASEATFAVCLIA